MVALAQQGKKVDRAAALSTTAPLVPNVPPPSGAAAPSPSPPKSQGKGGEWVVTQQQVTTFDAVFVATDTDKDGFITGAQARDLFISYGIPVADLKVIWDLSDMDKDEKLSRKEFILAMYLILRHKQQDPLPPSVPQSLLASLSKLTPATPAAIPASPVAAAAAGQQPASTLQPFTAEESDWYRKGIGAPPSHDEFWLISFPPSVRGSRH